MTVFVVGMHRSGTSTMVRLLEAAGFDAGTEDAFHPPTTHDPEGHREHIAMWSANETALAAAGCSWDQPVGLDWTMLTGEALHTAVDAVRDAWATIGALTPGVAKDPRTCLTLPLWRRFVQPTCVMVHREPLEVAASLQSRDGWPLVAGIALWEAYVRAALLGSEGLPRVWADFTALSERPEHTMTAVLRALRDTGIDAPPHAPSVDAFRPSAVRHRATPDQRAEFMNAGQLRLLDAVHASVAGADGADEILAAAAREPLSPLAADTLRVLAVERSSMATLHRSIAEDRATIGWLHQEVARTRADRTPGDLTATLGAPARGRRSLRPRPRR